MSQLKEFSIIIPSWNNLPFLKLCIGSIFKNSKHHHQVIVHVNEGDDGTADWLKSKNILHSSSLGNIGLCRAFNSALPLAKHNLVMYMNDDMYVLPQWDEELRNAIPDLPSWMVSSTMIEPHVSGNRCVTIANYGETPECFREEDLLNDYHQLAKRDWSGASWPPVLIPAELLKDAGGFSEEFSPGLYSDPDLAMKLWQHGTRYFRGVGKSLVYHFQSKTTNRTPLNNGRLTFMKKWYITPSFFYKNYLRMGKHWSGLLHEPPSYKRWANQLRVALQTAGK